ncbi:MAG: hypothetical protein LAT84_04010 [Balneolia bacterium]|nr:hypothetical protein [Balneolia bacterium]
MDDALKSDLIRQTFTNGESFTRDELRALYRKEGEDDLNENTLLSRIYGLKKKGVISSYERGLFVVGGRPDLKKLVSKKHKELARKISSELPHIRFTIWELQSLMSIVGAEPKQNLIFIETDKEACESVFEELKEIRKDLFLKPDDEIISRYASMHENPVVIKPLISEAPLDKIKKTTLPSLEKLCVDLMVEQVYFSEMKGQLYREMLKKFFTDNVINHSALRRYASRRGCKDEITKMLHSLNITLKTS